MVTAYVIPYYLKSAQNIELIIGNRVHCCEIQFHKHVYRKLYTLRQCKINLSAVMLSCLALDYFISFTFQCTFTCLDRRVWKEYASASCLQRSQKLQCVSGDLVGRWCALTRDFACLSFRSHWYMLGDLGGNSRLCDCCNHIPVVY